MAAGLASDVGESILCPPTKRDLRSPPVPPLCLAQPAGAAPGRAPACRSRSPRPRRHCRPRGRGSRAEGRRAAPGGPREALRRGACVCGGGGRGEGGEEGREPGRVSGSDLSTGRGEGRRKPRGLQFPHWEEGPLFTRISEPDLGVCKDTHSSARETPPGPRRGFMVTRNEASGGE